MSGFFMMRRELFDAIAPELSTHGFKVLLDIVASSKQPLRVVELPFTFRARQHGQSKLDSLVVLEYLGLLLAKLSADWLSIRFVLFSLVGSTGLLARQLSQGARDMSVQRVEEIVVPGPVLEQIAENVERIGRARRAAQEIEEDFVDARSPGCQMQVADKGREVHVA